MRKRKGVTEWRCEDCGRSGGVTYPPDAGAFEVFVAVLRGHAAMAPECPADFYAIRITPAALTASPDP